VSKGQATVEYTLLAVALAVAVCLLVRYATPVADVARAVAQAVSHRPARHRPHALHVTRRRPPHRRPAPCLCPFEPPPA
jgi:Flp pilus assembly pilin Flp